MAPGFGQQGAVITGRQVMVGAAQVNESHPDVFTLGYTGTALQILFERHDVLAGIVGLPCGFIIDYDQGVRHVCHRLKQGGNCAVSMTKVQ